MDELEVSIIMYFVNSASEISIVPFLFPGPFAPRTVCKVGLPLPGAALQAELAPPDPENENGFMRTEMVDVFMCIRISKWHLLK